MKMKKIFSILMCMIATMALHAQAQSVTGTVVDAENGEPLIGVSVLVEGTSVGTVTDLDGNFVINAKEGALLQLSYVGYTTLSVEVGKRANLGILKLESESQTLQDVTITGQIAVQRKTPIAGENMGELG